MLYTSATILDSNAGLVALAQVSYMLGLSMHTSFVPFFSSKSPVGEIGI